MRHELVNGTLTIERDKNEKATGVRAVCTCGWSTSNFSATGASSAFSAHVLVEIGASKTGEGEDCDWY